MLETAVLAATANPLPTLPGLGVPYPWGASAADEIVALAVWDLGRRWIAAHYDNERQRFVNALQVE